MTFMRDSAIPAGVPSVATLTAINAGGRAISVVESGGIQMIMSNGVAADDFRILKKAAPAGAYTFTVHVYPTLFNANYSGCGIVWRNSASGSIQAFGPHAFNSSLNLLVRNESASNNGASPAYTTVSDILAIANDVVIAYGAGIWLQFIDDGTTNRVFRYSTDGINFLTVASTGRTATMTPDEIGIYVGNINSNGSATQAQATFDTWLVY